MKTRFLSILMVAMLSCATFAGQSVTSAFTQVETTDVEEDPIYDVLVSRSDVELTLTNDATYPWTIEDEALKNGNCGVANSASSFTLSFKSEYKTDISFDWYSYNYSTHRPLEVFVDGVSKGTTSYSSYRTLRFYLEPGEHVIMFKDIVGNYSSTNNYSYIKNFIIKEITPLEHAVLTEDSKPITFKNDSVYPWTIEDGYIQNGNYGTSPSVSRISTTITVDTASVLSFERQVTPWSDWYSSTWDGNRYIENYYHYMIAYVDGEEYMTEINVESFQWKDIYLEPGTHTIEWVDSVTRSTSTQYFSRLRNVKLQQDWLEIDLATPGTLGVEVLYKVNVLTDVQLLKVKGTINDADWTNIKQMKYLLALDLSEAKFDAVPANQFDGHGTIKMVKLPEGMTSIGANAFKNSPIQTVNIPSTIQSIGEYAFYECNSLTQMLLPDALTSLGRSAFYSCDRLSTLHFPANLTTIPSSCCYDCYNLKDLRLPTNLKTIGSSAFYETYTLRKVDFPEGLEEIGSNGFQYSGLDSVILPIKMTYMSYAAFANCSNLTYVELPTYLETKSSNDYGYYSTFNACPSLKTIVCKSATPPSIVQDPFKDCPSKTNLTLKVPAFAVANYKLDTYWYQFGNIEEIDVELDYWKIAGDLSLTNNRRMGGKPDLDLYFGGKMTVGGNAPMETANFNWFVNESNPGCLLNNCTSVSADSLNTYYTVEKNKWYFFTPAHDVDLTKVSHSANASYVFRYYDAENRATNGTGNSWRNVDTDKLIAGQGYIFHCDAAGTVTMPAEATSHVQIFNVGDVTQTLNVYESTASANKNWNYVGNPYPTYYDIYYMDFTAPITVWTGSTYKAYSIADDNFVLRPMQSFFVQKPDEVDQIVFHKEGRQLTTEIARPSYAKAADDKTPATRLFFDLLIMNDNEEIDETRIVVHKDASLDYEMETDASKFMSMKEEVPQIFSTDLKGNSYAINERPMSDGSVNMGYRVSTAGYYTISATRADGGITLYDNKTNKTVDLTSQDYYFYSEPTNGTDNTRFVLKLNGTSNPTDIADVNKKGTTVQGGDDCLQILCNKMSKISVFTSDGRKVCEKFSPAGNTKISVPGGIYVVRVNSSTFTTVVF